MSQTKAIVETIDVSVDQIKPSPYQPRLSFNLEDIRGSIQRDGILVPLTVREKDGYYELIDGERRVRLAKELGYKTVPCTVIDVDDETARRMVWKVNTLRQEYTPKEKGYYFKKLQEEYGMSLRGIARECDFAEDTVVAHLNALKLPEKYQNLIWDGPLSVSHIQELRPFFNQGAMRIAPITELLDQVIERKLTRSELRETIRPELREIEERRIEAAQQVIKEVTPVPEEVKLETPEDLEEAARVLRREAKKRKTPEQIREEKQEEARSVLLTAKSSVVARVGKAKELGIDTNWMEEEKEKIENKISFYPDDALSDAKALKKQVNEMISGFQERQKEVEIRKNVEKEFEEEKVEAIKEELRKDETFKTEIRTELMKEIVSPSRIVTLPVEIPEEEAKVLRERIEKQRQKMAEWMLDPEIQKRGKLFKNWVAHGAMLDVMGSAFCPDHPETTWKDLKWSCGLSVEEAYEKLRKKLEQGR